MSEPTLLLAPLKPRTVAPRLWADGRFVADPWHTIAGDAPLPADGPVILPLARWRTARTSLAGSDQRIGVTVAPGEAIDPVTDAIARLDLIALDFPKFSDGRAYSTARRLREQGFRAEIRATGDVLLDQIPLMLRAGFDAFLIVNAATVHALETAPLPAVTRVYQAGSESSRHAWRSRRAPQIQRVAAE